MIESTRILTGFCLCVAGVAAFAFPDPARAAEGEPRAGGIVRAGKGSYTLTPPPGMKLPPREIFRTAAVAGPMPTTDWWSSAAWEAFSANQFAHPLGVRATAEGLQVSYPGARIRVTPKHVFAGMTRDLVLGHSKADEFPDARVDGFSDWFVSLLFVRGDARMRVTYGHGSPFVFARFSGGGAAIRFGDAPRIWSGSAKTPSLGVTVGDRHYGLFGPAGSTWRGLEGRTFVNEAGGKDYFSLALLPDANPETLDLFRRHAHAHVTDTRVAWKYVSAKGIVETTFTFRTERHEGEERRTIFALYPHQWLGTPGESLPFTYASIRGPMKVRAGDRFTTVHRFPGVLPALPGPGRCDRERLRAYVNEAARAPVPDPADTYWQGKALGTMANLIPIAEQSAGDDVAAGLREALEARLETWLTAPSGAPKQERYFFLDRTWGTLIGQRPSFGSSDQLNDHHFHYGYFIRAAAEVARSDRAWAAESAWGAMVKLLIRDIAGPDREDPAFPFLRCFDPYAGHSWASGHARFGDGNNQESSSEAMNAWTGIILWGEATGDRALRDLGIYLYATELAAAEAYWFDVEDRFLPDGFEPSCAALIWGGKTDYATWFSGEPEHTHGIILLPIQSGSLYLGLRPEYVTRNLASLAKLRGSDRWKDWHETLWPYEALADADAAMRRFEAEPKRLSPQARAFVYHWIGALQALGPVDRSVFADHPTAIAFARGRVAWNMTARPVTVRFSDGTSVPVAPGRFVIRS
ncbi:MAG: glycoside hydrolase family 81 [Planctomycetes bacterium]|nr:glycoside hydrolase family 81 [Planctomycetota bacterium]